MSKVLVGRILAAAVPLLMFAGAPAHAGITCRMIEAMCPPGHGGDQGDQHHASVPEPATLLLLSTGFGAAGLSAWRRRKQK